MKNYHPTPKNFFFTSKKFGKHFPNFFSVNFAVLKIILEKNFGTYFPKIFAFYGGEKETWKVG
jgi:hypothetical protein